MKPSMLLCAVSILACAVVHGEPARIEWLTANNVTQEPAAGYADVPVPLVFVNAGGEPFTIRRIRTTCNCTKAAMPAEITYAPGATGVVSIIFPMVSVMGTAESYTVFIEAVHQIMPLAQWTRVIGPCPGMEVAPRVVSFQDGGAATQTVTVVIGKSHLPATVTVETEPVIVEGDPLPPVIEGSLQPYGDGSTNIITLWRTGVSPPAPVTAMLRVCIGGRSKIVYATLPAAAAGGSPASP
ncbi:DUF1573 domain-containing protein [bacterium]|nr:DUF1573 domain-containing protein [bacterium]